MFINTKPHKTVFALASCKPGARLLLLCSVILVWCWQGCSSPSNQPKAVNRAPVNDTITAKPHPEANVRGIASEDLYQPFNINIHEPLTARACKLYADADTASAKLAGLPALAPLTCYGTRIIDKTDTLHIPGRADSLFLYDLQFVYVKYGAQKGFLKLEDVLPITLTDTARGVRYAIGHRLKRNKSGYQMQLQKTGLSGRRLLASADVDEAMASNLNMGLIKSPRLKDVHAIIKITNTDDYCGGSDRALYLADAGTVLVKLPLDKVLMDDGGGVENDLLFLPVMQADSTFLLLRDTVAQTGSLIDSLAFPTALAYPPNQVIATQSISGQYAMNDNGDYIKTKDGYYKMQFPIVTTTRYYHWNGRRFNLLPYKQVERAKPEKWKD